MSVPQKRGRWLISVLLILAIFAFVGFSFLPVVSEALKQDQPAGGKAQTSAQATLATLEKEMQERAKGYEIVLQREPNNPRVLNEYVTIQLQLGQLYAQQLRYDDAIAVFDRTRNVSKQDYRPLLAKGIILQLQGKTAEAKAEYAAALDLAPAEEKAQLKAEIQQLESKVAAPPNSSPNPKTNSGEVNPTANPVPESNNKTNITEPVTPATLEPNSQPSNTENNQAAPDRN